jgi:hypothetical protein
MKFEQAKRLLTTNINQLSHGELYSYKTKLNSLYFILNGTHGEKTLLDNGFIIPIIDCGAKGFVPKDKFMFTNLLRKMDEADKRLKNIS